MDTGTRYSSGQEAGESRGWCLARLACWIVTSKKSARLGKASAGWDGGGADQDKGAEVSTAGRRGHCNPGLESGVLQ